MIPETELENSRPAPNRYQELVRLVRQSDLARKVSEMYGTHLVLIVATMAITIIVARLLGPEGRGLYAVALAMGTIGVQFGNIGLHASNTYFVAKDRSLLPQLVGNSLLVSLVIGGSCAALVGLVFYVWPRLAPVHGTLLALGLLWVPIGLAYLLMQNLLLGIQEVRSYNKIELGLKGITLSLVGALAFWKIANVSWVFTAGLIALFVSMTRAATRLSALAGQAPTASLTLFRRNMGVGFRAYVVAVLGFLVLRIDLLMVQYMLGAKASGYYSIAGSMGDYMVLFPTVVGAILFPKLSASNNDRDKLRLMRRAVMGTAVLLVPLAIVSCLLAAPAVRLLFGAAFLPAAQAFIWLVPGLVFLGLESVAVQYLNSLGYPFSVIMVWIVSVVLNVALNVWAIPAYGILGASVVSSITYVTTSLLVFAIILLGKAAPAGGPLPPAVPEEFLPG